MHLLSRCDGRLFLGLQRGRGESLGNRAGLLLRDNETNIGCLGHLC